MILAFAEMDEGAALRAPIPVSRISTVPDGPRKILK